MIPAAITIELDTSKILEIARIAAQEALSALMSQPIQNLFGGSSQPTPQRSVQVRRSRKALTDPPSAKPTAAKRAAKAPKVAKANKGGQGHGVLHPTGPILKSFVDAFGPREWMTSEELKKALGWSSGVWSMRRKRLIGEGLLTQKGTKRHAQYKLAAEAKVKKALNGAAAHA